MKDKFTKIRDYILEHSKYVYPLFIVIAVAIAVVISLELRNKDVKEKNIEILESNASSQTEEIDVSEAQDQSLVRIEDQNIVDFFVKYYDAYANGDVDTVRGMFDYLTDTEALVISEMSKYISAYPDIEVYAKPGPVEHSYISYVYLNMKMDGYEDVIPGLQVFYLCASESGEFFFKNLEMINDSEIEFINALGEQDDVKELQNRVEVDFNNAAMNNPELMKYVEEVAVEVKNNVGKLLAEAVTGVDPKNPDEIVASDPSVDPDQGDTQQQPESQGTTVVTAKATTTVNVRSSDSEKSDKIGKVPSGAKVEVVEQKVNGWSHIKYESLDGYIKSEFLKITETEKPGQKIGTVTASSNVNVRQEANQNSDKIGIISGGESVDLLENQGEWCKISYNGQVGYVKSEFVQINE